MPTFSWEQFCVIVTRFLSYFSFLGSFSSSALVKACIPSWQGLWQKSPQFYKNFLCIFYYVVNCSKGDTIISKSTWTLHNTFYRFFFCLQDVPNSELKYDWLMKYLFSICHVCHLKGRFTFCVDCTITHNSFSWLFQGKICRTATEEKRFTSSYFFLPLL